MATEVLVPPLGQTVDTVTLVTWYKNEGDMVVKGQMLFAIETDKATLDVEAPASGVLRQVIARPGEEVQVLKAIALIAAPDEAIAGELESTGAEKQAYTKQKVDRSGERRSPASREGRIFVSPRARRLAEEHAIPLAALSATGPEGAIIERDVRAYLESMPAITPVARRLAEASRLAWRELTGSGPGGRITRDDVSRALAAAEAQPKPVEEIPPAVETDEFLETIPLRSVRAVIAERMVQSRTTAAQVTLMAEADATALVELRQQLAQDGLKVGYNDLFIYILARALRDHPRLNASLEGDIIKVRRQIHIGLAVDTERGLLVPVVRHVAGKGLQQIAQESQALIERALAGQCTPDELSGGSFTLTNLGMYGIDAFTPIINLPECAILGVGRITRQPVMVGDEVVGRQMVWLSLSFDHRLVDGGPAARFLQRVAQLVERPHLLMA